VSVYTPDGEYRQAYLPQREKKDLERGKRVDISAETMGTNSNQDSEKGWYFYIVLCQAL
jgi:hypothetical protein